MRRVIVLHRPALALALGLVAVPATAPAQQGAQPDQGARAASAAFCAQLIAPLERRLKEAEPRLERAGEPGTRKVARSQLLFELLSEEEMQKTLTQTLACLAAERQ